MVPSESTPDAPTSPASPHGRSQRSQWIVIVILSLAMVYVIYQQVEANLAANVATDTAQDLAEPVDELCRKDPDARREIGDERCGQAADVQRESTVAVAPRDGSDGKNGRDGSDGRGIVSTAVVDGHLFVTYTDGVREDKGVIATNGENGRGITGARLNDTGQLVLTFTDGTSTVVGRIVGRDGNDGRGITDVVVSSDYHVIVTYTDGTIEDVGALPPGPSGPSGNDGPAGRGVDTIDFDMTTCTATVHYSDGTSETKTMTGCEKDDPNPPTTTTTDGGLPLPTG
jgi:hypothetical protein